MTERFPQMSGMMLGRLLGLVPHAKSKLPNWLKGFEEG